MWMIVISVTAVIFLLILLGIWQDNDIVVTETEYKNRKIPAGFEGFRIMQISDLHNKSFGREQRKLLENVRKVSPDIIVVTGDLVDRRRYDLDTAMIFIDGALDTAPVFYVPGNHEGWSGRYDEVAARLKSSGVSVLENASCDIMRSGESIRVAGLSDPAFLSENHRNEEDTSFMIKYIESMPRDGVFTLILSHRPELFGLYAEKNLDLVFSGHAHGGQIRLPFIGGLYAPGQGVFPRYTSGIHEEKDSAMVVSRGLGNSLFPIRFRNRPDIPVVTLHRKTV